MMRLLLRAVAASIGFAYGLFTFFLYIAIAVYGGIYFRRPTEREDLELQLARDRFWNLSKQFAGLSHQFLTLKSGFKFHYVCNDVPGSPTAPEKSDKPLVIFVHGFPDSWALYRNILAAPEIQRESIVVAVDLPGFGGSDLMRKYGATEVLESLTAFVLAIRTQYGIDGESERTRKVVIFSHDWGAVLCARLAAEAPQLADRFITTNGPHLPLYISNIKSIVSSSVNELLAILRNPFKAQSTVSAPFAQLRPVITQISKSGYIFAFNLPRVMVSTLGTGGNHSFLKTIHKMARGKDGFTLQDAAEGMATTSGPGLAECKTVTSDGQGYPEALKKTRVTGNFLDITAFYRDNTGLGRWKKSTETMAALQALDKDHPLATSVSGKIELSAEAPRAGFKAPATVIWGQHDFALEESLNLNGIDRYLVRDSLVILLPRSGHFTPVERESGVALRRIVEWAVTGEEEDLGTAVSAVYPGATVSLRT